MADIKLMIEIPEKLYYCAKELGSLSVRQVIDVEDAIKNGKPLTPDVLEDLLMEERIRGELKQDISYSKDIIDDVKCELTVQIIDRRPCYCGAGLKEVWRESEDKE